MEAARIDFFLRQSSFVELLRQKDGENHMVASAEDQLGKYQD